MKKTPDEVWAEFLAGERDPLGPAGEPRRKRKKVIVVKCARCHQKTREWEWKFYQGRLVQVGLTCAKRIAESEEPTDVPPGRGH